MKRRREVVAVYLGHGKGGLSSATSNVKDRGASQADWQQAPWKGCKWGGRREERVGVLLQLQHSLIVELLMAGVCGGVGLCINKIHSKFASK